MVRCDICDSACESDDEVFVCERCGISCHRHCLDDCGSPTYFCNFACLSTYVDENGLMTGDACEWSPDENDCF